MPKKPVSQLSPAYAKRIARAEALGKTRQQARGHKEKEHVIRKQKEIELGGLTTGQKQQIKKFAEKQLKRTPYETSTELKNAIIEWTNGNYHSFIVLRDAQKNLEKGRKGEMSNSNFEASYGNYLNDVDKPARIEWFYYH